MFGSINTDPAYTFTQSENRQATIQTLKLLSNYFGEDGVQQKGQIKNFVDDSKKTDSNKTQIASFDEDENELTDSEQVQSPFSDEDDDDEGLNPSLSYDGKTSSITTSFQSLAAAIGSSNERVTKEQLIALLQSLASNGTKDSDAVKEITFVKNLIAKFDVISDGEDYITSFNGINEPQDPSTVTKEQVTFPIDIKV